ncbi:MAG: type III-B CRISPR module-associated protein Cmr5 [Chloroflexi bacterium]|nr:type III-B CRISPR module-associated protein Cmr5 [Chloroflexota bacterium]
MHTINQQYATDVYERVKTIYDKHPKKTEAGKKFQKKYGTMAHKLPILVRTAGLVQAVAFVDAKSQKVPAWRQYLDDVAQTVDHPDSKALLAASQRANLSEYILLTHRVSAALVWYKRFAESVLNIDQSEQDDSTDDSTTEGTNS